MKENMESIAVETKKEEIKDSREDEITPEFKKFVEFSDALNNAMGIYEDVPYFLEPDVDKYEREYKVFLEEIEDKLESKEDISKELSEKISPEYFYSVIEEIKEKELEDVYNEIDDLEKEVEKCEYENVKKIIIELIDIAKAKIKLYQNIKENNYEKAFDNLKIVYGDVNEDLFLKINKIYDEKIEYLKNEPAKSELEKELSKKEFDSEDIKEFIEMSLKKAGLGDSGYKVVVTNKVNNLRVSQNHPEYGKVVLIPPGREVNAIKILELVSHEVGRHIVTDVYNRKQGFRGDIGREWISYSEGIAKVGEKRLKRMILGDSYVDFEIKSDPYYILAMEKIKKENYNYAELFKYIYKKVFEEKLSASNYYDLLDKKDNLEQETEQEKIISNLKNEKREEAIVTTEKVCFRVFKGLNPKEGGKYNPKDKAYLEGEIKSIELEKIMSENKFYEEFEGMGFDRENLGKILEKYLRLSKVDPKFIPYLVKMGAYRYEKGLEMGIKVAERIWDDKGWIMDYLRNKDWYKENTQMDRHWAYRKEFMNEDLTDVKDEE